MDIRDLIIEKKDEIEYGKFYANTVVFENYMDDNFDITTEGVGEKLSNMKDRAVEFIKGVWKKVQEWFEKLVYNFKTFIAPTSKFMKKNGAQIIMLYKKHADTMTMVSKSYDKYDPGMFDLKIDMFMTTVNSTISSIRNAILIDGDRGVYKIGNNISFGREKVITSDGMFHPELAKKAALNMIISDPEAKQRKLKDVMQLDTFVNALDGKAHFKDLKKYKKHINGCFQGLLKKVENYSPDEKLQFNKSKFVHEATKWANLMSKAIMTIFSVYMSELKNMNRITKAVVKRLYKIGKDDVKNSEPDESDKKLNDDRWIFMN